jgi:hypothetical protein
MDGDNDLLEGKVMSFTARYLGLAIVVIYQLLSSQGDPVWREWKPPLDHAADLKLESAWLASQQPSHEPVAPLADDVRISLSRTGCDGSCPAYVVSLYGSGRVEFDGIANVCESHPRPVAIGRAAVARIVQGLDAVGFDAMPSYTDAGPDHNRIASITLRRGGAAHIVEHSHGDVLAPRLLGWIEQRIDDVSRTARWTEGC